MKPKKIKVMKPDGTIISIMPAAIKDAMKMGYQVVPEPIEEVFQTPKSISEPEITTAGTVDLSKGVREIKEALKHTTEDLSALMESEVSGKNRKSVIDLIKKHNG